MNSYLFGRKQYSPICNIEEGDNSSLRLKLNDGVSPMTYKKLKELGYTSDDWQNWSDDEKFEKSQAKSNSSQAESGKQQSPKESASAGAESLSRSATESTESVKYTPESYKQLKQDISKVKATRDKYIADAHNIDRQKIMQGKPLRTATYSMEAGNPILLSGSPYYGDIWTAPEDKFVAQVEGWVDGKYMGMNTFYDTMHAAEESLDPDLFKDKRLKASGRHIVFAYTRLLSAARDNRPYDPDALNIMKAFFESPQYKDYVSEIRELSPAVDEWYAARTNVQEQNQKLAQLDAQVLQAKVDLGLISQQEQDMIKEFPSIAKRGVGQKYVDEIKDMFYVMSELERSQKNLITSSEDKAKFARVRRALDSIGSKLESWNADFGEGFDKLSIKRKYTLYKALKEVTPELDELNQLLV